MERNFFKGLGRAASLARTVNHIKSISGIAGHATQLLFPGTAATRAWFKRDVRQALVAAWGSAVQSF